MIKEWATVVSWQNGLATVSCDVKASCSSCASRAGCGSRVLNKLGPQTTHTIVVPSVEPLAPGQKVELGIAEGSLLGSAMLVYLSPLAGLFVFAALFQVLFGSDIAALSGAILGGVGGFLIARGFSRKLAEREAWQPVILNVALPPDLLRVETHQRYICLMALRLSGLQDRYYVGQIGHFRRTSVKVSLTLLSCFQFPLSLLYEHFLASAL